MPENDNENQPAHEGLASTAQAILNQLNAQPALMQDIAIIDAAAPEPHFHAVDFDMPEEDNAPGEDGPGAVTLKKKKAVLGNIHLPQPKTPAMDQISRHVLITRAAKIPRPKHSHANNDIRCVACRCRRSQHGAAKTLHKKCTYCGNCPTGFLYYEQVQRVYFTEFMRWSRRWIKANKKRDMEKLRTLWRRVRNTSHLQYCGTCDTPTFSNSLHGLVKRQDGLQCASCRQCSTCCKCVACDNCKRRKHEEQICKTCQVCVQCCQCRSCPVCNCDCSFNYCGFAFTAYQKQHRPGCQRCYKCCNCGDYRRVPFGSFARPVFHTPTLKQHNQNPTSRYIAAEIECAGITGLGTGIYDVARRWGGATVGDGSLHYYGFEFNTAPAGGDLYNKQIEEVCAAIKQQNGFLDNRCGLHVHVDARDMNYYDIRRLVRVYVAIEDGLFAMVSPQRIKGIVDVDGKLHQYCQPCGKKYVAAIEEGRLPYDKIKKDIITSVYQSPSTQDVRHRKRHPSRYNALNLHSWFYRGTIECRMFDGCLEPEPIINWGILWAMIIEYVVKSSDEQVAKDMVGKPLACLAKIVGGHKIILDFIKARVLMFGSDQMKRDAGELLNLKAHQES